MVRGASISSSLHKTAACSGKGGWGLAQCALVIRDGKPAEDGQSAGGVKDGRLGAAQTSARAALVALLVRK